MEKINPTIPQVAHTISQEFGEEPRGITPIGFGEWSTTFSYHTASGEYIIRFSALDDDFRSDAFAMRFSSPKLPVPRILRIGQAYGGFFAVSEKAPGLPLELLSADQMRQLVPAVLDLLDALRQTDVSPTRGYGGWMADGNGYAVSWRDSLLEINIDDPSRRVHGWREKLAGHKNSLARFDAFYDRFSSLVKVFPEDRHLIHSDLMHYNLLVDQGRITAVVDWGCARYGDFLYELAWFTFWSPWHENMTGIDWKALSRDYYARLGLHLPTFDQRLTAYELHIGLDSVVYCAYVDRWKMVEKVLDQMELLWQTANFGN